MTTSQGRAYADALAGPLAAASEAAAPRLSRAVTLLLSVACGLAVANISYAQPLLDVMARDFSIDSAAIGIVITVTQIGYGLGLLLVTPLGDVLDRRRMIVGQSLLSALALLAVALAPTGAVLLAAVGAVGVLAVVTQVMVAHAAGLADPRERGAVVGIVTSGIIVGILLARTVAGSLSDLAGWRSVYVAAAAATLLIAALLAAALPRQTEPGRRMPYLLLVGSVLTLFRDEPILRARGIIAFHIFFAITALLTPLVLPLTAPPLSLSQTEVGLFGLAGAAGALGASAAGRLADRGGAQRVTALALALMLLSWLPIAMLPISLWGLVVGIVVIDFGLQAAHVANQGLIYRVRPDARSRMTAGYMMFYSAGCALGAIVSTIVYAQVGWTGLCIVGAAVSASASAFWYLSLRGPRA